MLALVSFHIGKSLAFFYLWKDRILFLLGLRTCKILCKFFELFPADILDHFAFCRKCFSAAACFHNGFCENVILTGSFQKSQ